MSVVRRQSRDELLSHLKVLLTARQRLIEAEAQGGGGAGGHRQQHAAHRPLPNTGDDHQQQQRAGDDNNSSVDLNQAYDPDYVSVCASSPPAAAAVAVVESAVENSIRADPPRSGGAAAARGSEPSSYNAEVDDSRIRDREPVTPAFGVDDFYPLPLDDDEEPAPERRVHDEVSYYYGYGEDGDEDEELSEQQHIRLAILAGRLHVPHIVTAEEAAPASDGGFGGVPASAAAVKALKRQKYRGAEEEEGGGSMCVICMREYKKGRRVVVMPCEYGHRFHGKCLRKWLARSHLCPLCRHPLPTDEDQPKTGVALIARREGDNEDVIFSPLNE